MGTLLASLGSTTLSKSQVSEMAKELDSHVEEFRTRSLTDAGPFTFVAADALVLKVREGGRVASVHALGAINGLDSLVPAKGCERSLGVGSPRRRNHAELLHLREEGPRAAAAALGVAPALR